MKNVNGKVKKTINSKINESAINGLFDGIQVTVNSDDEELDYEDELLEQEEDEIGSMDEQGVFDEERRTLIDGEECDLIEPSNRQRQKLVTSGGGQANEMVKLI